MSSRLRLRLLLLLGLLGQMLRSQRKPNHRLLSLLFPSWLISGGTRCLCCWPAATAVVNLRYHPTPLYYCTGIAKWYLGFCAVEVAKVASELKHLLKWNGEEMSTVIARDDVLCVNFYLACAVWRVALRLHAFGAYTQGILDRLVFACRETICKHLAASILLPCVFWWDIMNVSLLFIELSTMISLCSITTTCYGLSMYNAVRRCLNSSFGFNVTL